MLIKRGDFMKLEMYQVLRLKTGEIGTVLEIFKDGEAYMVDIRLEDDTYEQRTIYPDEIASVFVQVEKPFMLN